MRLKRSNKCCSLYVFKEKTFMKKSFLFETVNKFVCDDSYYFRL